MNTFQRAAELITDRVRAAILVFSGILLIAAVDFLSGFELRVFPLYYAPIALAAWSFGKGPAMLAACASAFGWLTANQLAGQQYSHSWIWAANTFVQGASFGIVGYLVAGLRLALTREQMLSRTDPLSGLMNHRAFYDESKRLLRLCRRGRRPVTLAYLDLDDFKAVNDLHGHLAGDDLLRAVGHALQSTVRLSDLAARLGGDEFAVLLPELGADEAGQAVTRIRDAITQVLRRAPAPVTLSIGAVTWLAAPDDVETMVQKADSVMYAMKKEGKNRIRLDMVGAEPAAQRG